MMQTEVLIDQQFIEALCCQPEKRTLQVPWGKRCKQEMPLWILIYIYSFWISGSPINLLWTALSGAPFKSSGFNFASSMQGCSLWKAQCQRNSLLVSRQKEIFLYI